MLKTEKLQLRGKEGVMLQVQAQFDGKLKPEISSFEHSDNCSCMNIEGIMIVKTQVIGGGKKIALYANELSKENFAEEIIKTNRNFADRV